MSLSHLLVEFRNKANKDLISKFFNKKALPRQGFCGAERIRTAVQTYSPIAFYTFILALIVKKQQGLN